MSTKSLLIVSAISFAAISLVQAQSPPPAESPSAEKQHRTHKKSEAAASPAQTATTASAAESPAASPKAKRGRKKAQTSAAASPAASAAASASPAKFNLGDLFKPKTSAAASPASANMPSAKATRTGAATNTTAAPGGGHGLVWVNTDSHIYHKEGSRFYGKTK